MKIPGGSDTGEVIVEKKSHFSVWLVVLLLAITVFGGGGFFIWSQWETLIAPIIVPAPVPTNPLPSVATSTPGTLDLIPPPSSSSEAGSIMTDLNNTPLDIIDTEIDNLDQVILEATASSTN